MNEMALRYEYVIRAAHQVGRLDILAAHADAFRALEINFTINRDNNDAAKSNKTLFEYAYMCGEISTNLQNALDAFEKNIGKELDDNDRDMMNDIDNLLIYTEMKELDQAVELFENFLRKHGRVA
jgi:tetratricopeptide (TPR) repeat protein